MSQRIFLMNALAWIAEQRIQEAVNRGDLDALPGRGKPLVLEDDSGVPEDLRMACKILRNAGYAPPEAEDRKEAASLADLLRNCTDEQEKVRQMRRLDVLMARIERARRRPVTPRSGSYYPRLVARVSVPGA